MKRFIPVTCACFAAVAAVADHTFPPFDLGTVGSTRQSRAFDTSAVPNDTYIGAIVSVDWIGIDTAARRDGATIRLTEQASEPAIYYYSGGDAIEAEQVSGSITLHWFVDLEEPYAGGDPLCFAARQWTGSAAIWTNITVTLVTESPLVPALDYLATQTITVAAPVNDDTTDDYAGLFGGNGISRDAGYDYYGWRDHMGWEHGGDAVYRLDWPGGDIQIDLTYDDTAGDLDVFLWSDEPPPDTKVAYAYDLGPADRIQLRALPPGTYFVHVDGWFTPGLPFQLSVTSPDLFEPTVLAHHTNAFNNFGPGDTYRIEPDSVAGLVQRYQGWEQGPRIIPTTSGYLTEIAAAIHMAGWHDDNIMLMRVMSDDNNQPGDVLEWLVCKEEMRIGSFPATTFPIYFQASGTTWLQAGQTYWLVPVNPGPHYWGSQGVTCTWAFNNQENRDAYISRESPTSPWLLRTPNYKLPATRVVLATPEIVGDSNCDGILDVFDINPFVTAILDPAEYAVVHSNCDLVVNDINGDGDVDVFDINPFVDLLLGDQ